MITECPWARKPCEKNKCYFYKKYMLPVFDDDNKELTCIVFMGYCSGTGVNVEVAEGTC